MIKLIVDFMYKTIDKHSGKYLLNLIRCQAINQHRIIPIAISPFKLKVIPAWSHYSISQHYWGKIHLVCSPLLSMLRLKIIKS